MVSIGAVGAAGAASFVAAGGFAFAETALAEASIFMSWLTVTNLKPRASKVSSVSGIASIVEAWMS